MWSAGYTQDIYDKKLLKSLPTGYELTIKNYDTADEAYQKVIKQAGASLPRYDENDARILKEAAESRDVMVEQAKQQARDEASRILDQARTQIAAEKENALRDIRKEVAVLSVGVAEKVLRKDLGEEVNRSGLLDRLVEEASSNRDAKLDN
jgi:F-type H+-transporting ATPase subunit b